MYYRTQTQYKQRNMLGLGTQNHSNHQTPCLRQTKQDIGKAMLHLKPSIDISPSQMKVSNVSSKYHLKKHHKHTHSLDWDITDDNIYLFIFTSTVGNFQPVNYFKTILKFSFFLTLLVNQDFISVGLLSY